MITKPPKSPPTTIILGSSHSAGMATEPEIHLEVKLGK